MNLDPKIIKHEYDDIYDVYGLSKNILNDLSWSRLGKIKKSKTSNEYGFYIKINVVSLGLETLDLITNKLKQLNKGEKDE